MIINLKHSSFLIFKTRTYAYMNTQKLNACGCAEPQIHKRPSVTFLTFLLSCNLSCRICLVTVIFCCHGAYASPCPAPLESSKHKLNKKSGISYIPHLKGAQKQAEIMLRKITQTCWLLKTQAFLMLTFKESVKDSHLFPRPLS